MHLPRYDEPAYGDEVFLVGADGRPNNLHTKVQQVLSSDIERDLYEIKDQQGRVLVIRRVSGDTWQQTLDWE